MMDVLMIAILLGCFGLVKAFADFCDWQIKPKEKFKTYSMNNKVELSISFKDKIEKFLNKWNYKAEIRQWEIRAYTPITIA